MNEWITFKNNTNCNANLIIGWLTWRSQGGTCLTWLDPELSVEGNCSYKKIRALYTYEQSTTRKLTSCQSNDEEEHHNEGRPIALDGLPQEGYVNPAQAAQPQAGYR